MFKKILCSQCFKIYSKDEDTETIMLAYKRLSLSPHFNKMPLLGTHFTSQLLNTLQIQIIFSVTPAPCPVLELAHSFQ